MADLDDLSESDTTEDAGEGRMSFLEHLEELRKRLLNATYGVLVACLGAFAFVNRITDYLQGYLTQHGQTGKLIYTEFTGGFMFYFKTGMFTGLLFALPWVFWQLWLFIAPGLYKRERKMVVPFVFFSSVLAFAGFSFAHFVAIPSMIKFFGGFQSPYVDMRVDISLALDFYLKMVLAFAAVFQMPMLVFFLARFGMVTARFLWKNFRYAILIIFIIAAIATPTSDPLNQTIFAAPMIILYLISIGVAWMFQKKKEE